MCYSLKFNSSPPKIKRKGKYRKVVFQLSFFTGYVKNWWCISEKCLGHNMDLVGNPWMPKFDIIGQVFSITVSIYIIIYTNKKGN